jgi:hypothetical protein
MPRGLRAAGRAHGIVLGAVATVLALAVYQGVVLAVATDAPAVLPGNGDLVAQIETPSEAESASALAVGPPIDIHVDIAWRARLRRLPPPPVLRVLVGDEVVPASATWLAGSASVPLQTPRAGDTQLVRVAVHGEEILRVVKIHDGGATVRLGGRVRVQGQVIDPDGRAVARARVFVAGEEMNVGDDGAFALEAVGGDGLVVVARAPGMAAQAIVLDAWSNTTLRLVLQPTAPVRVRVVGVMPGGDAPAQVIVLPAGEPVTNHEAQYPFFMQALRGGVPVSARGVAVLDDLPPGARVRLRLVHGAAVASDMPVVEARSRPVEVTLVTSAGAAVRGHVRSADGQPVVGATVLAWPVSDGDDLPRGTAAASALPPVAYCGCGAVVRTTDDGAFQLPRSPRWGDTVLHALGASRWGTEVTLTGRGTIEHDLTLPALQVEREGNAPTLALHVEAPGNYRVHVRAGDRLSRGPTSWIGTSPLPIALRAPALVDVAVRVGAHGSAPQRSVQCLPVVGTTAILVPAEAALR